MPTPERLSPPSQEVAGKREVWSCAGKFFQLGEQKAYIQGVSYGPFRPNSTAAPFPELPQLQADLRHIRELGFNSLRLYHPPSAELIASAAAEGLHLWCALPWSSHLDFLRSRKLTRQILATLEKQIAAMREEPQVAGFWVGNEIEKSLVRWMGPERVRTFLEELIQRARNAAPEKLFSYSTYPSTEYLIPRNADFISVNVYLETPEALDGYLRRLQHLAGDKPLVISEFGLDVRSHSPESQKQTLLWFEESCQKSAIAGSFWFSYTDEWFRSETDITDWQFGLVTAAREPRPAALALQKRSHFGSTRRPKSPLDPTFSIIICSYNGSATLGDCLASLRRLKGPQHEILLIDDGSTQDLHSLCAPYPEVRYLRQEHAGLSAARNIGAREAKGDILAYLDDDCMIEENWLGHLSTGFDDEKWVACGGPNIPPSPRSRTESVVASAPGAPAHVMLDDEEAEHLPGCNLAIRKNALLAIGGFREPYKVAGDDVDVCWRLRAEGGRLRFLPGAMVWHHRRCTLRAYFKQQRGYGHAEALLMLDHPDHFGLLGGAQWGGAIYGSRLQTRPLHEGTIAFGTLGTAQFQGVYQEPTYWPTGLANSLASHGLTLLFALAGWWPGALLMLLLSLWHTAWVYRHQPPPLRAFSLCQKALLFLLCWLQPWVREAARVRGMLMLGATPRWRPSWLKIFLPPRPRSLVIPLGEWSFWSEEGRDRHDLLSTLHQLAKNQGLVSGAGNGWERYDYQSPPGYPISRTYLTVTEYHGGNRMLTRVRSALRLTWPSWGIFLLGLLLFLCAAPHWKWALSGCLLLLIVWWLRERLSQHKRLKQAANKIGLQPL